MNRIRAIAVVLSMVLFLVGAAGNTEEKTSQAEASYEGKDVESTLQSPDQSRAAEEVSRELPEESPQETNTEPDQNIQPDEVLPVEVQPEEEIKQEEPQRIIDVTEEDYTALLKIVEAEASGEGACQQGGVYEESISDQKGSILDWSPGPGTPRF